MRVYAYVTAETCRRRDAVKPGDNVGLIPAHRHGDYTGWNHGKRYTIFLAHYGSTDYIRGTARAVCLALGWEE